MLDTLKTYLRYTSWPIIAAMVALIGIGVTAIHVTERADASMQEYMTRQTVFACVALGAFIVATVIPYGRFGRAAYPMLVVTLALLALVFFLRPVRGSHRWIDLKFVQLQPSELAKLSFIIALAWYLRYRENYRRLSGLVLPFLITLVPMGMVFAEPDLGTSLLFLPTLYFMLYVAGAKLRHLLVIVAMGTIFVFLPLPRPVDGQTFNAQIDRFTSWRLGPVTFYDVDKSQPWERRPATPVAYCRFQIGGGSVYDLQPLSLRVMKGYQAMRIEGWLKQDDPRVRMNKGYQLHQSMVLLAAGQLTGRGDWTEGEAAMAMLPDDHTDFIFSVVGGQWGLLGCMAVLGMYAVIFLFGVEIATITYDPFGRLLAVGVLSLLVTQIWINAGMTMGLMPITGMTLPFISYGGCSLVINCFALGLLVNVGQRRPILLSRRPFEHGDRPEKPPAPYGPLADGWDS